MHLWWFKLIMGLIQLSLRMKMCFIVMRKKSWLLDVSAQWALTTHPGSDAFDAKNCWWVDFSGGRG